MFYDLDLSSHGQKDIAFNVKILFAPPPFVKQTIILIMMYIPCKPEPMIQNVVHYVNMKSILVA